MESTDVKRWPGESDEAFPEVFCTIPPQPNEKKPGQLTPEQLKQFFEEGFVVIDKFFLPEEIDPCRKAIEGLVDDLAKKLYKGGKIKELHEGYDLFKRLIKLEEEFPGANIMLHKIGKVPQAVHTLWANERILNIIEQLVGPDVMGNPIWNLRTKTPNNEATVVPWHQDSAYMENEAYGILVPTAWIPLLDAKPENGCMQYIRKGHVSGKTAKHQCCAGGTWYVMLEEDEMEKTLGVNIKEDLITVPVPYGGFVLFNNLIPHRSLSNTSNDVRWSFDLRWQSAKFSCHCGSKPGVLMRSAENPNMKIDWETFDSIDRHEDAFAAVGKVMDEFDTTIQGPWMHKWQLVHLNKHTDAFTTFNEKGK